MKRLGSILVALGMITWAPGVLADEPSSSKADDRRLEATPPVTSAASIAETRAEGPDPDVDPSRPRREGFTLELGLGGAVTSVSGVPGLSGAVRPGIGGLSLGLGGFVSRDLALSLRITGSQSWATNAGGDTSMISFGAVGLGVQYYVTDRVFAGASAGLGHLTAVPLDGGSSYVEAGIAGSGRVGWAFFTTKEHQLAATAEVMHARLLAYGGHGTTGVLGLGYQFY